MFRSGERAERSDESPSALSRRGGRAGEYILKEAIGKGLLTAIRAVYSGNHYSSKKITTIADAYLDQNAGDD